MSILIEYRSNASTTLARSSSMPSLVQLDNQTLFDVLEATITVHTSKASTVA